ncbi:hypothetical protein N9H60_03680 [Flavimaricola sp.]|nr:hypothetical protein [Flavimaricola sp.]MDA9020257.1 hypothetical protein [Flavimaricola sp.]
MFTNVLKKFFTGESRYENKEATRMHKDGAVTMAQDIKSLIERTRGTLVADALGAVSLVVILMGGLCLPAFV